MSGLNPNPRAGEALAVQTFVFNDLPVRTVFVDGEWCFVAADAAMVLAITQSPSSGGPSLIGSASPASSAIRRTRSKSTIAPPLFEKDLEFYLQSRNLDFGDETSSVAGNRPRHQCGHHGNLPGSVEYKTSGACPNGNKTRSPLTPFQIPAPCRVKGLNPNHRPLETGRFFSEVLP